MAVLSVLEEEWEILESPLTKKQKEYAAKWQKAAERLLESQGYTIVKVEYEDHPRPLGRKWAGKVNASELGPYLWGYSDLIVANNDWYVVDVKAKWYRMLRKHGSLVPSVYTKEVSFTDEELRVYPEVSNEILVLVVLYRNSGAERYPTSNPYEHNDAIPKITELAPVFFRLYPFDRLYHDRCITSLRGFRRVTQPYALLRKTNALNVVEIRPGFCQFATG